MNWEDWEEGRGAGWGGNSGVAAAAAANMREISNFLILSVKLSAEGVCDGAVWDERRWSGRAIAVMLFEVKGPGAPLSMRLSEFVLRK